MFIFSERNICYCVLARKSYNVRVCVCVYVELFPC